MKKSFSRVFLGFLGQKGPKWVWNDNFQVLWKVNPRNYWFCAWSYGKMSLKLDQSNFYVRKILFWGFWVKKDPKCAQKPMHETFFFFTWSYSIIKTSRERICFHGKRGFGTNETEASVHGTFLFFSFLTWSYSSIKAENWVKHVLANFCFGICRDSCFLKKSCFAFFAETILINCELKIHLFLFKCTKLFIKITTSIIKIDFGAIFSESIVLQSIYFLKERWVFNIWLIELEAFQLSPSCTQCHVVLIKLRMLRENIYFIWLFLLIIWESFIETEYKECNLGKF